MIALVIAIDSGVPGIALLALLTLGAALAAAVL